MKWKLGLYRGYIGDIIFRKIVTVNITCVKTLISLAGSLFLAQVSLKRWLHFCMAPGHCQGLCKACYPCSQKSQLLLDWGPLDDLQKKIAMQEHMAAQICSGIPFFSHTIHAQHQGWRGRARDIRSCALDSCLQEDMNQDYRNYSSRCEGAFTSTSLESGINNAAVPAQEARSTMLKQRINELKQSPPRKTFANPCICVNLALEQAHSFARP